MWISRTETKGMDRLLSSRMFVMLAQLRRGHEGRGNVPHFWPGIAIAEYDCNVPYFDGSATQVMLCPAYVAKKLCWCSILQIDVCSLAVFGYHYPDIFRILSIRLYLK